MKLTIALIGIILIITSIVLVIRIIKKRKEEAIRHWCILLYFKTGNYKRADIEKMAEFLIRLPNKELKYYKKILPLTHYYTPVLLAEVVEFITQGTTFSKPSE